MHLLFVPDYHPSFLCTRHFYKFVAKNQDLNRDRVLDFYKGATRLSDTIPGIGSYFAAKIEGAREGFASHPAAQAVSAAPGFF